MRHHRPRWITAAVLLSASLVAATPVPGSALAGLTFNDAVSWTAGRISTIGDDDDTVRATTTWSWFDCGEETDAVRIKSIALSPDPPKPGHELTIYGTGTVNSLIDDGAYADVTVKLGLIKLLTKRFDICEELANANATLQCPVGPDDYKVVQTVKLPDEIPRAKYQVDVQAFTQLEDPMACLSIVINFMAPTVPKPPMN